MPVVIPRPREMPHPILPDPGKRRRDVAAQARKHAKEYWAYLENYHAVWGYYPWERGRQPVRTEYVYQRDPKQAAKEKYEYYRARAQLRLESKLIPVAKKIAGGNKQVEQVLVRAIKEDPIARGALELVVQRGRNAVVSWALIVLLHREARGLERRVRESSNPGQTLRQEIATWRSLFGREIITDGEMDQLAARPDWLYQRLIMGFEGIRSGWTRHANDRRRFVEHILDHDEGYPRALNYFATFIMSGVGAIRQVVDNWLNGFSNTDAYTCVPSTTSHRQQFLTKLDSTALTLLSFGDVFRPVLSAIAQKVPNLGWEKDKVVAFVREHLQELCSALDGLVDPGVVRDFVLSDLLEDLCEQLYMS